MPMECDGSTTTEIRQIAKMHFRPLVSFLPHIKGLKQAEYLC